MYRVFGNYSPRKRGGAAPAFTFPCFGDDGAALTDDAWYTNGGSPYDVADSPVTRYWSSSVGASCYMWVAGGFTTGSNTASNRLDRWDLEANSYSSMATMPAARVQGLLCHINGKLYFVGGSDGSSVVSTVYEYDIAGDSWSTLSSDAMPTGVRSAFWAVHNDILYVIGGHNGTGLVATVQKFDPSQSAGNKWLTAGTSNSVALGFWSGGNCNMNGVVLCAGGRFGTATSPGNRVFTYDIGGDSWTEHTSTDALPSGDREHHCGEVVPDVNGTQMMFVGRGRSNNTTGDTPQGVWWRWDNSQSAGNKWTTMTALGAAKGYGNCSAVLDNLIATFGGVVSGTGINDVYVYAAHEAYDPV